MKFIFIICFIIFAGLTASKYFCEPSFASTEITFADSNIYGDANDDGVLNEFDAECARDRLLGKNATYINTDSNQDGISDIADITKILNDSNQKESLSIKLPNNVAVKFIKINSGSFIMGLEEAGWSDTNESPAHNVNIGYNFYMSKYELTEGQWHALFPNELSTVDSHKIKENLSWDECNLYISKLNELNIGIFRLPSEAEWEYACRGGTSGIFFFGDSTCSPYSCETCELDTYAWWCGNNQPFGTKFPGLKLPNPFGLYDMSGNVMEWCLDNWHDDYTGCPTDGSAWIDSSSDNRILRGGYWDSDPRSCKPSARYSALPDGKDELTGLRLLLIK